MECSWSWRDWLGDCSFCVERDVEGVGWGESSLIADVREASVLLDLLGDGHNAAAECV